MAKSLTIVAHIQAKLGTEEFVKSELLKLVEPTLKEEGCLQYDLHIDNENKGLFLFFENWGDRDLWQAHMQTEHIKVFIEATEHALENFSVEEMTKIS